jgi:hypothetical protein
MHPFSTSLIRDLPTTIGAANELLPRAIQPRDRPLTGELERTPAGELAGDRAG